MVSAQTTQLWTLAKDTNEYERMHNLFSGKLKSVLNDEKISSALREKTAMALGSEELIFALHDPCDIRKPYSKKLDNIGRVRDLQGNMINGYSTFGTVCLSSDGQGLHFSDISIFSNGDKEHYVLQTELDAVLKKQKKAKMKGKKRYVDLDGDGVDDNLQTADQKKSKKEKQLNESGSLMEGKSKNQKNRGQKKHGKKR